ncbi:hypothetical protein ASPWEDRAFT_172980 [Aspergillus wentii DTO 134E9]|uniref:DUF4440 domain-containing protein n=1 Tax=Aspergillus wentii DTO 134E9 TaxID=1073089 RepID=A0A1L9RMR1_ASPWE|nr:uncharacterized protein ASPWEDRAFT_172980 [Aspergillus wentii DTO 134E9]OJJ36194.1 hypothetical protein ASPWEDRAFT_172980 [Aspergillus wentii DTO 134E9]
MSTKQIPTSQYDDITAAESKYVDGLQTGSSETVSEAFHKDAIMYGLLNGNLLGGPIKNLYDYIDQHGSAPHVKTRLNVIGITGSTAMVKVDMEKDGSGRDYTDFLTLIKLDGKWEVIAKVFHVYE